MPVMLRVGRLDWGSGSVTFIIRGLIEGEHMTVLRFNQGPGAAASKAASAFLRDAPSEKGNRLVERILSVRQTCRLQSLPLFPTLVDALEHYFNATQPDLSWVHA